MLVLIGDRVAEFDENLYNHVFKLGKRLDTRMEHTTVEEIQEALFPEFDNFTSLYTASCYLNACFYSLAAYQPKQEVI
jgi:hypothetical protein